MIILIVSPWIFILSYELNFMIWFKKLWRIYSLLKMMIQKNQMDFSKQKMI